MHLLDFAYEPWSRLLNRSMKKPSERPIPRPSKLRSRCRGVFLRGAPLHQQRPNIPGVGEEVFPVCAVVLELVVVIKVLVVVAPLRQ